MSEAQSQPIRATISFTKKTWLVAIAILVFGVLLQQYLKRTGDAVLGPAASLRPGAPQERISVKLPDGWKTYENKKLGFTAMYPENAILRGTEESEVAIVMLDRAKTEGKQSLVTLTKKKVPLGRAPYVSLEEFWKDEQEQITANSGVASAMRYVEVNDRVFWEAREDNRQINYMGLHRYLKTEGGVYEVGLNVEGDALLKSAVDQYNQILASFTLQ